MTQPTRPQIASEPSDAPDGVKVPGTPVEGALLLRTEQRWGAER